MFILGSPRYITFKITDASDTPVTGRTTADLSILFLRNNVACTDTLQMTEMGGGRYVLAYNPSGVGHDYVEIQDSANDLTVIDEEDIVNQDTIFGPGSVVIVDHNYGGADALRVSEPDPTKFKLYLFESGAWEDKERSDANAAGVTSLLSTGRWATSLPVVKGSYHVVLKAFRVSKVIRTNLIVQ